MTKLKIFFILLVVFLFRLPGAWASFPDVDHNHPNYDAIEYVQSNGIVHGYPDGSFQPDKTINRAEFTKIVTETVFPYEMLKFDNDNSCFSDVDHEAWYSSYVCFAKFKNIVAGYPDGLFHPDYEINFAEASKIIIEAFDYDISKEDPWYRPYVKMLEANHAIPVTIDAFDQNVTRGEMAEMIYRMNEGILHKDFKTYEELSRVPVITYIYQDKDHRIYFDDLPEISCITWSEKNSYLGKGTPIPDDKKYLEEFIILERAPNCLVLLQKSNEKVYEVGYREEFRNYEQLQVVSETSMIQNGINFSKIEGNEIIFNMWRLNEGIYSYDELFLDQPKDLFDSDQKWEEVGEKIDEIKIDLEGCVVNEYEFTKNENGNYYGKIVVNGYAERREAIVSGFGLEEELIIEKIDFYPEKTDNFAFEEYLDIGSRHPIQIGCLEDDKIRYTIFADEFAENSDAGLSIRDLFLSKDQTQILLDSSPENPIQLKFDLKLFSRDGIGAEGSFCLGDFVIEEVIEDVINGNEVVQYEDFENIIDEILFAINNKDYELIDSKYIDQETGIYALWNQGVATNSWHFDSFDQMMQSESLDIVFDSYFSDELTCDFKYEEIPSQKCVSGDFDFQEECIIGSIEDYSYLSEIVIHNHVYMWVDVENEDEAKQMDDYKDARNIEEMIQRSVSLENLVRFDFSLIDGNWYLTVVDLSDCSA